MQLVFDIETDGLDATRVWCIHTINVKTGEEKFFDPLQITEGVAYLERASALIGHNIISFDIPVLNRLHSMAFTGRMVDTLILSRLFKGTMPFHSLEFWGRVFKQPKQEHEDWSQYSADMKSRCITDTRLNLKLYEYFIKKGHINKDASVLEHFICEEVNKMTQHGFLLDTGAAEDLIGVMKPEHKKLTFELEDEFPSLPVKLKGYYENPTEENDSPIKWTKQGHVSGSITRGFEPDTVWGEFTKIRWLDQNFNSNQFLIRHLTRMGWEPDEFTEKGNPKLGEEQLDRLYEQGTIPQGQKLGRWSMLDRRITQVQSWLDAADINGRVHANIRTPGTWTYRMTHSNPNMSAVPSRGKPFAKECRSMWTVPDGYRLLGCDASGIQLRVLAEGMQDQDYCDQLLVKVKDENDEVIDDIHITHMRAAGLSTRDQAKTFIYAFLLGAGLPKLGAIAGEPPDKQYARGKKLKQQFLTRIPALDKLIRKLKDQVSKQGYIIGLDGRRVYVPDPHYALAGLLQANESIIMKKAYQFWSEDASHLDWNMVQWSHDEWQTEVAAHHVEELAQIQEQSFRKVQQFYGTMVQLDGEAKIGSNWYETH